MLKTTPVYHYTHTDTMLRQIWSVKRYIMICKSLGNSLSERVDCQEVERKHTKMSPMEE